MKLSEIKDNYYFYSGKTSDITRQLGFAGIAVIWIFKTTSAFGDNYIPQILLYAGIFIFIGLACDYLQYATASAIWGTYHRQNEINSLDDNSEIYPSKYINWPALFFYTLKILFILTSYILIISYVFGTIKALP